MDKDKLIEALIHAFNSWEGEYVMPLDKEADRPLTWVIDGTFNMESIAEEIIKYME